MNAIRRKLKGQSAKSIVEDLSTSLDKLASPAMQVVDPDEAKGPDPPAAEPNLAPEELAKRLKAKKQLKAKISELLASMKFMLYGDADNEPKDDSRKKLTAELNKGCLTKIILQLQSFDFEGKKDAAKVANHIIRRSENNGSKVPLSRDLKALTESLIKGYEEMEGALPAGSILQEIVKQEHFAKAIFTGEAKECLVFQVMKYVEKRNFDVASDAFTTLKLLTTRHKSLVAKWLLTNYSMFFQIFNGLINSENYVTRRQSLRLLGEILLERKNFDVMMRYIEERENLKLMMNMLKNKSSAIQFEAFHVFKVFVANPKQPYAVKLVLWNNKKRLLTYLKTFQQDREDPQFIQEKGLVISHLQQIVRPEQPEKKTPPEPDGTAE